MLCLMLLKEKEIPPSPAFFLFFLGQVRWRCKAHVVNTCPVISKAFGSGAFQELQYSLEKSTLSIASQSPQVFFLQQPFQTDSLTYRLSLVFVFRS